MRLLLVEDDLDLGNGVRIALGDHAMDVVWVRRLSDALRTLEQQSFEMVLLDLGLPDGDGISLLTRLRREWRRLPVLILSARDSLHDRLHGLDSGADDYLVKPFALVELVSRVRALARRSYGQGDGTLHLRGLSLHEPTRRVSVAGQNVELSRCEFDLLALLLRRMDRVVTRSGIEEEVIPGGSANGSNALEVHVSNLRRKIGPGFIRTVRGIGYVIDSQPMAPLS
ncbi:two component transcriptional regulator, winged helix family [Delftia acidovorans SPH-1]|uniref:Two component transcriptional regulator, winged helix family n=1 Tax=Delftia acidovorans (strain DSM 14801 / SPH-1) TaxID=398578 RepID=A9BWR3_DELAS|nr:MULTISPECIES: response regulator [Delftia]OLE95962.1 MAG: DNA-binding response regulator [Delftia sp. 13_1_40CM_3_66_6]ABX36590.1 two component transcriptional regulator, winged helix family [Delftia acidovorans SPH-1]MBA4002491.1 DNA-binding response regulator [Delftia sp.]MBN9321260.1 response regulator [Delftia acidovorans]MCP4015188.1 response regulator [Delftia sp.]